MTQSQPTILVCNDDGYLSEGLTALREAVAPFGRVVTVAPSVDNSGVSHKITLDTTLRIREVGEDIYMVNGTPVDCVHLAVHGVLDGKRPDLVVSGINRGVNLGEDTAYSGTVGAAYEGYVLGSPSIAFSTGRLPNNKFNYDNAAKVARMLVKSFFDGDASLRAAVWNVNVPATDMKGIRVVSLDKRSFKSSVIKRLDPRGTPYYWIGPYHPTFERVEGTDYAAFHDGYVSMTPLKVEMTHFDVLNDETRNGSSSFAQLFDAESN